MRTVMEEKRVVRKKGKGRNRFIFYVSMAGVAVITAALISKSVWNHIRERDIIMSEDG